MSPVRIADLRELFPYAVLTTGALLLLLFELMFRRKKPIGILSFSTCLMGVAGMVSLYFIGQNRFPFNALLVHDPIGITFTTVLFLILILSSLLSSTQGSDILEEHGAVYPLMLLSTLGAILISFANHLFVFFVGLEILSLPLYVLVGLGKNKLKSSESAFKYFLLSSVAAALFVYGSALLWGCFGSLTLTKISILHTDSYTYSPGLMAIGLALVTGAIVFKIGLIPFHMWIPDVYEGAPAVIVGWMTGIVKVSVALFAIRLFGVTFKSQFVDLSPIFSTLAVGSMIWGSVAALDQVNSKRMLAFSSIAHAGYIFLGVHVAHLGKLNEVISIFHYYLATYSIASLVVFSVVALEESEGRVEISDLKGLAKRKPVLALVFSIGLLSLAGLPPLAGFFGKYGLFSMALASENPWAGFVVFAGILTSVISFVYYLKVIVSIYMVEPAVIAGPSFRFMTIAVLFLSVLILVFLGIKPDWLLNWLPSLNAPRL